MSKAIVVQSKVFIPYDYSQTDTLKDSSKISPSFKSIQAIKPPPYLERNNLRPVVHPSQIKPGDLSAIIDWIVRGVPGGGIAACDESLSSIGQRFKSVGVSNTDENRRLYRLYMINAPKILQSGVTGMILWMESLTHRTDDGMLFGDKLLSSGVIPIVKPDLGAKAFGNQGEKLTEGLQHSDGKGGLKSLKAVLDDMAKAGARAAKWRAEFVIDNAKKLPSDACIDANVTNLALYAKACHEAGIVPMVEPEIMITGSHTLADDARVTGNIIQKLFEKLNLYGVDCSKVILKTNMIVPGKDNPSHKTITPEDVAKATLDCFMKTVPFDVPTINFLSGGLNDEVAMKYLSAISEEAKKRKAPWNFSFSFGRGIQSNALKAFGQEMNKPEYSRDFSSVQRAFEMNANNCRLATLGQYR